MLLLMITAHHLVLVVVHNTVPPHLEVMTPDPLEDIGVVTIGINVIIKMPLHLEVKMTDSRNINMIKVITIINEDTSIVGAG